VNSLLQSDPLLQHFWLLLLTMALMVAHVLPLLLLLLLLQ
jgi:hypothetical protein